MRHPGMGAMALHLNRNKRSIALDLKQPEGRAACLRLAAGCDALIYNTRPQAMARLGLAYEDVAAVNPRIVYLGAFGYGEEGPYAGQPAYDDLIQGAAGVASSSRSRAAARRATRPSPWPTARWACRPPSRCWPPCCMRGRPARARRWRCRCSRRSPSS